MIQYLVILLDDTSVSYCHFDNIYKDHRLMPIDILKEGIVYGMKENLNIQFVYPDYELPKEYNTIIEEIDHTKIKPFNQANNADVVVFNGFENIKDFPFEESVVYVFRTSMSELFENQSHLNDIAKLVSRVNIIITDIETFNDRDFDMYKSLLESLAKDVELSYQEGKAIQINIITDRIMLNKMNNCGAGDTCITLAPDGKFYVCPAFYNTNGGFSIGSIKDGLDIKNHQLYKLDHAPLCRNCDAYQCKRCIWLNRKTTFEVNTPSHEQCVVAHIERNTSRKLLMSLREKGFSFPDCEDIKEIKYLDPFEIRKEW